MGRLVQVTDERIERKCSIPLQTVPVAKWPPCKSVAVAHEPDHDLSAIRVVLEPVVQLGINGLRDQTLESVDESLKQRASVCDVGLGRIDSALL